MATSPTVSLRGISLRRPGSLVLRSVDLIVEPGEAVAVFGGNGSGKTTLLRLLATLLAPSDGSGEVLGARLGTAEVERVRPRIGLVGHEAALYPNLSLGENLRLVATLARGVAGPAAADDALARVGLAAAATRHAARSSNGMKRRVDFARMLVVEPMLLLLDEAHVGLDPAARGLVGHLVAEVTGRGGSAVVVAHEEDRVRPIVQRAVTLIDGSLQEVSR
jgi:ABC-type multidrug transport system ATPase subunit